MGEGPALVMLGVFEGAREEKEKSGLKGGVTGGVVGMEKLKDLVSVGERQIVCGRLRRLRPF